MEAETIDSSTDEFGIPIKKGASDEYGIPIKKKVSTSAPAPTIPSSSTGLNPFQGSPQSTDLTPVLPEHRDEVRQQQIQNEKTTTLPTSGGMIPVKLTKPAPISPQSFTQTNGSIRKDKSWENLGDFVPNTVLGGLQKDAGQAIQFVGDNFAFSDNNPLSRFGARLEGTGKDKQAKAQELGLPDTAGGTVASSAVGFAPDLIELALTPELDVAKLGKLTDVLGKYGNKALQIATGKFPTLMAAKGLTSGYVDAKDNGASDYDATKTALIKSAQEYGKGALFEGAGKIANKASDIGKKALEDAGWMADGKIVSGAQKAILNSSAQATAFSAVPFITNALQGKNTSLKELQDNAIFGGVLGLFHGSGAKESDHTAADGAAAQVAQRAPLIDLSNFANADIDAIKEVHDMPENVADLKIKAAIGAEQAFKAETPEEKQQAVLQSSIDGKSASVKAVTEAILKDKQSVIDAIPDGIDKQPLIDKINEVHKAIDPTEQKKTIIGNQISDIDKQIESASEKTTDPVLQAENEVKLEALTKQREELNNGLKELIIKQTENSPIKPNSDEQSTKKHEESSPDEEKSSQGGDESSQKSESSEKSNDVNPTGGAEASPVIKNQEDATKEFSQQKSGGDEHKAGDESGETPKTSNSNKPVSTEESKGTEKPRFQIKQGKVVPLPLKEHAELNAMLKSDHGITIQDIKDEQSQRNASGDQNTETPTDAEAVRQPEDDGTGNVGENRPSETTQGAESTFKNQGKEIEKTILTQRAYKGDISDEVKAHLEEKGLNRASFSQEERSKQATDFIDKFGDDAAYHAVKSGDIDGGMAASILAQLQIRNSRAVEDLPEDSEEREELVKKHADLIDLMEKKGYFSGEFIGQLAHEYQNTELNFASIKRQVEKITGKKLTKEQETKIKEVTEENERLKKNLQDAEGKLIEETDKAFKAGQEDVRNETKADKAKRIANKLRAAKIHRPGIFSAATPASVAWDGAVEVVAKSIEVGGKLADAIDKGLEHIRDTDWYKGLSENKKSQAEKEFKGFNHDNVSSTDIKDLQSRFVDKADNKFTTGEARDLWGYMKETYLNNGVSFRDAISKTANDLGLSWRQVSEAITTPKTKRASDEMWKRQSELLRNRSSIKSWIGDQEASAPVRLLKKISGAFRGVAVFAHGHIFIGTHAGMTLFNPSTWSKTIPAFFRGFKLAYGKTADYERAMEELKNSPNYLIAQRAGLKNDPERINTEEFQKSQQYLGKLGKVGERGFNTIKVLRQALFDHEFNNLSAAERDDPEVAKEIAKLMNLATGATNLNLPTWVNETTFAGGMEAARWGKLTRNPAKATMTALNTLFNPEKASVADRVFAKVWAKRVGEQLATYMVARTVNATINNYFNPEKKEKVFDPLNPDWWKFRAGNTTVDPTSGMRSAAGFIATIGHIMFKKQKDLHGDKRDKALGKEVAGYARGKLAPLYSTLTDFYANRDFKGNVMPKFPVDALNRKENPGKDKHVLSWPEYGSSKLPLPMAESFGVFYQSALDRGVPRNKLDAAIKGIIAGAISGTTGFRVGEDKKGKMKKVN